MTPQSQAQVLARADGSRVYDLSVDFFVGDAKLSSCRRSRVPDVHDAPPNGTIIDNLNRVGERSISMCYSGEVVFFYAHWNALTRFLILA
ncbi:MAG: hypothetical protein KF853_04100 [Rhodocyclaceae bacterium]|nr:hypothetical protein [Rhodocyclaceae bacterium]